MQKTKRGYIYQWKLINIRVYMKKEEECIQDARRKETTRKNKM
jgi:hypothetical protein